MTQLLCLKQGAKKPTQGLVRRLDCLIALSALNLMFLLIAAVRAT